MNKKDDFWKWVERNVPPGTYVNRIRDVLSSGIILGAVVFLVNCILFIEDANIVRSNASRNVYDRGTIEPWLPTIHDCIGFVMLVHFISALILLCFVISNYAYFQKDSKSVYTMGRIPSKWELHRRCWMLPGLGAIICTLTAAVFYGFFCWLYFHFAPEGHIPEQTIAFLWRYVP